MSWFVCVCICFCSANWTVCVLSVYLHSWGVPGGAQRSATEAGTRVHQYQNGWRRTEGKSLFISLPLFSVLLWCQAWMNCRNVAKLNVCLSVELKLIYKHIIVAQMHLCNGFIFLFYFPSLKGKFFSSGNKVTLVQHGGNLTQICPFSSSANQVAKDHLDITLPLPLSLISTLEWTLPGVLHWRPSCDQPG